MLARKDKSVCTHCGKRVRDESRLDLISVDLRGDPVLRPQGIVEKAPKYGSPGRTM